MKKYWVYIHTCPNGKRYVGCTTRVKPELRWAEGRGYEHQLFGKAVRKYGWSSIKHEAWELTCKSEMYYAEKYLIAYYHTTESEYGYNNSEGGEHIASGCIRSEETRKRISELQKEKWLDPEYREKMLEVHKGKPRSEETKRRIAEAMKGKPLSKEHRKRMAEALKGRTLSEEHKKHIAEAKKGKSCKPFSEEHRRHISEAAKKRAKDPEYRKKLSEAHKNRPKVKIKLPDGTIVETTKNIIVRWYVNKGRKFEYVS